MPRTQTAEISLKVFCKVSNAVGGLASVAATLDETFSNTFESGTGSNQANNSFWDERTLEGGANEDLDLAGVALTNAIGEPITATEVKGIIFKGHKDNTGPLNVSRPATNGVPFLLAAGDGFPLHPNGFVAVSNPTDAGFAVTVGTGDLINVANPGGDSRKYIVILVLSSA